MRRDKLINSYQAVLEEIQSSNIMASTDPFLRPRKEIRDSDATRELVSSITKLSVSYSKFNQDEREFAETFGLQTFFEPDSWTVMLSEGAEGREAVLQRRRLATYLLEFFPNVVFLLEQSGTMAEEDILETTDSPILRVLVIEDRGERTETTRIREMFEGIEKIYGALSKLHDHEDGGLILAACDSGSDKSFDFAGAGKIFEQIRLFILDVLNHRRATRNQDAMDLLSFTSKALPIYSEIEAKKKSGEISPSSAAQIVKELDAGAVSFMKAGATIPEAELVKVPTARQIMKADVPQIEGPKKTKAKNATKPPAKRRSKKK